MSVPIEFKEGETRQSWLAYLPESPPPESYIGAVLRIKYSSSPTFYRGRIVSWDPIGMTHEIRFDDLDVASFDLARAIFRFEGTQVLFDGSFLVRKTQEFALPFTTKPEGVSLIAIRSHESKNEEYHIPRDLLMYQSGVFAAMLSDGKETHLTLPDGIEDLRWFLRFLEPGKEYQMTPSAALHVARLAFKYDVTSLLWKCAKVLMAQESIFRKWNHSDLCLFWDLDRMPIFSRVWSPTVINQVSETLRQNCTREKCKKGNADHVMAKCFCLKDLSDDALIAIVTHGKSLRY
jgi:hypothetical protein